MRFRLVLSIASLFLLVAGASVSAASMPKGGTIHVYVVPSQGSGDGSIIIVGAVGDHGKTTNGDNKQGIGHVILSKGGFEVKLAALNKASNNAAPSIVDKASCSYVFSAHAPVTIMDGTGAYKGIKGSVAISETFVAVVPRYASGARKGQCNTNTATPVAEWNTVSGPGHVSFS